MSKVLTGLKLSEVVRLFEEGKAVGCRPHNVALNFDSLNSWDLEHLITSKWEVHIKEQKIEITLDKLEEVCENYYVSSANEEMTLIDYMKKELGFK